MIGILGAGRSGIGAAMLARKNNQQVWLSDAGMIKAETKSILTDLNVQYEENNHDLDTIAQCELVVKSPGIPDKAQVIQYLVEKKVPVISEVEYAFRNTDSTIIAITGSNGKTTTTSLIYDILNRAGLSVGLVGNIGHSFAAEVANDPKDYYVLEISSFQLDGIVDFKPNISVLLNITPDHLDRYNYDFDLYRDSKFRITENQDQADAFIYCADDTAITQVLTDKNIQAKSYPFSIEKEEGMAAFINTDKHLTITTKINTLNMSIYELALQGKHNMYNSMAAGIAARIMDLRDNFIKESLSNFRSLEHRLEFVSNVDGITFINDSKATNINSTWYALECMEGPVVLILGGEDKGNDYTLLDDLVAEKVDAIVCLGADNTKIMNHFDGKVGKIYETQSVGQAVVTAKSLAKPGATVLLSPACASFDLFKSYEDRGTQFKSAVKGL